MEFVVRIPIENVAQTNTKTMKQAMPMDRVGAMPHILWGEDEMNFAEEPWSVVPRAVMAYVEYRGIS